MISKPTAKLSIDHSDLAARFDQGTLSATGYAAAIAPHLLGGSSARTYS